MHRMNLDTAQEARNHMLQAIQHMLTSLRLAEGQFPEATYEGMRRTIGLAIGRLETDYLAHIFEIHPELDDLSESDI